MPASNAISLYNCQAVDTRRIPVVGINEFRNFAIEAVKSGKRIASLFASPSSPQQVRLFAVLADDNAGNLSV